MDGRTFGKLTAVTPSDSVNLATPALGLWVGGAGNIAIVTNPPRSADADPTPVVIAAVAAGSFLPIRTRRVNATSTTATNIVALS